MSSHFNPDADPIDIAKALRFENFWKVIAPNFTQANIDEKTQKRLRTSVNQLPKILAPLLHEPANAKNITKAKIIFFNYALKSGIPRALAKSYDLRTQYNLSELKLRSKFTYWFVKQIQELEETMLEDDSSLYADITIGQLLTKNPTIIYRLPVMT